MQNGYTLLVFEVGFLDRLSFRRLTTLVEEYMHTEGLRTTVIERGQHLAVVVGIMDVETLRMTTEKFLSIAAGKGFKIFAGISSPSHQVNSLRLSYQQAVDALAAAKVLYKGTHQVWTYEDLGFLGELFSHSSGSHADNRYTDIIKRINKYDQDKNTQYFLTLETYLDHQASTNQVVKVLFIHRNTLYQRLSKITDLWGIDFQDPLVMLNLNLAIKDWHLNRST